MTSKSPFGPNLFPGYIRRARISWKMCFSYFLNLEPSYLSVYNLVLSQNSTCRRNVCQLLYHVSASRRNFLSAVMSALNTQATKQIKIRIISNPYHPDVYPLSHFCSLPSCKRSFFLIWTPSFSTDKHVCCSNTRLMP